MEIEDQMAGLGGQWESEVCCMASENCNGEKVKTPYDQRMFAEASPVLVMAEMESVNYSSKFRVKEMVEEKISTDGIKLQLQASGLGYSTDASDQFQLQEFPLEKSVTPVIKEGPVDFKYGEKSLMIDRKLSSFNPYDMQCWIRLMNKIQCWLLMEVIDRQSLEWTWGREVFWMAYIAAYPKFSCGQWTRWSPKISPEQSFLEGWIAQKGVLAHAERSTRPVANDIDYISTRGAIWDRFQDIVTLVFDGRVVVAGI
ncbi:hypothetical protein SERLADRAFT_404740 [Serpula lacrymans var. lacrymans S7.9]|uniref:Uncharacterized protein n=1 Tax=Serpula lacrymans var. lacrymans (strain S7.9) TaxID=578457 RepID=F8NEN8_SERL9|nr:uncharacterized protein SERLADRAFT_404740 [Serpula lacrymans var. lacrymans S7.9]EGO30672.1 hypothetical protein SERLADRAFT_404740 [Serpula lacrymans var. lacrymans S7.9]